MNEVEALLGKAGRSFSVAERFLEDGEADFAASRLYYGCFYVAEALLLSEGLETARARRRKGCQETGNRQEEGGVGQADDGRPGDLGSGGCKGAGSEQACAVPVSAGDSSFGERLRGTLQW